MAKGIETKYLSRKESSGFKDVIGGSKEEVPEVLREKYVRNVRLFSAFFFVFAILIMIAIVFYSPKDEFVLDFGLTDLLKIIKGDTELVRKANEVNNPLGPVGAIVSNFFVNKTIGYFSLFFCIVAILISGKLYAVQQISSSLVRFSIILILFGILFASFLGSLNQALHTNIPISFIGLVGIVISKTFANLLGNLGAVLLLFFFLVILLTFTFDLELDKIFKELLKFFKNRCKTFLGWANIYQKNGKKSQKSEGGSNLDDESSSIVENPKDDFDNYTVESLRIHFNPELSSDFDVTTFRTNNSPFEENSGENITQVQATEENLLQNEPEKMVNRNSEDLIPEESFFDGEETNPVLSNNLVLEIETPIKQNNIETAANIPYNPISTSLLDEKINYTPPPVELLIDDESKFQINEEELKSNARLLQEKLETFKIYIQNLKIVPGPVVTQYEFVPAPGIKISRIQGLADDIALALKARGIRIIAPVPGKGTVGIEIPNRKPLVVRFGNCLKNVKLSPNYKLPIIMGKTISGDVYVDDIARMPHLLIAGATGSGKSVGINTIIASLIYFLHPQNLKLVIIDPKKVELSQYQSLYYHYLAVSPEIEDAIVTDPTDAVLILKALVAEMQLRYDILASVQQRNIAEFNKKVKTGLFKDNTEFIYKPMPYIVVIIDELADLMLTTGKEIESLIIRLAQLARAVGIHLVVATQRPSVDIITGLIKANFPARIAYLVASRVDSRTIIDNIGAEQLLGNGDMLFLPNGSPMPIRIQNAFLTTEEIENICNHIGLQKGYSKPYYLPIINENKGGRDGISKDGLDDLFEEAARLIVRTQQASVSMIQRRLKVGYNRAGRIMDELEALGIVGPFDGSKGRTVKISSEEELNRFLREKL